MQSGHLMPFGSPLQPDTHKTCIRSEFVGPTLEQTVHCGGHVRVHPPALQLQHLNAGCECGGRPPLTHRLLGTPPAGLVITQGHAAGGVRASVSAAWSVEAAGCFTVADARRAGSTAAAATRRPKSRCRVGAELDGHAVSGGVQRAAATLAEVQDPLHRQFVAESSLPEHGTL